MEVAMENGMKSLMKNFAAALLGPPAPRVAAMKITLFGAMWKMSRIFRESFLQPFSLEIEGWKLAKNFVKIEPHFSLVSYKNFARTSLWEIVGTMLFPQETKLE